MHNLNSAVFFDLDGTLLDTAHDLAQAINLVLIYHGYAPQPYAMIRGLISAGSANIVASCFNITQNDVNYLLYKQQQFLEAYQQCLRQHTAFFPGITAVLSFLQEQQIPWGIVTNKPLWLAMPLLSYYMHNQYQYNCLIGRETLLFCKPHPSPLLYACNLTKVAASHSIYVGDAKSDILAAKSAGMHNIVAAYGYLTQDEQPALWQPNYIATSGADLLQYICAKYYAI